MKRNLLRLLERALPLAAALAAAFVLVAKIGYEWSVDRCYSDLDRIYRIGTGLVMNGESGQFNRISGGVAPGFRQYVPGVETATRVTPVFDSGNYLKEDGTVVTAAGGTLAADTSFFAIFDRPVLAGIPAEELAVPGRVMVSRRFAEQLGGIGTAVGRKLRNVSDPDRELTVGGVFEDFPANATLEADVLLSMPSYPRSSTENWLGNDRYAGYVKLYPGVCADSLGGAVRRMQERFQPLEQLKQNGLELWYYLEPLSRAHTSQESVRNTMVLLSVLTFLLLSIALLNYLLSVVSSLVERSRSFATRKCFGAGGREIFALLTRESALTLGLAAGVAALLLAAADPLVRSLLGIGLADLMLPVTVWTMSVILLLLFFLTSFIPARLFLRVPVAAALRTYTDTRRKWKYLLLCGQFVINVFLFGMLAVMVAQYRKVLREDPGYDTRNVYYVYLGTVSPEQAETYASAVRNLPGVSAVEGCSELPFQPSSGNNVWLPDSDAELFNVADQYFGTAGFFDFFRIPMLEGLAPRSSREVAVSRSFVEKMNEFADWSDGAVGRHFLISEHSQQGRDVFTVCGVYEDYLIGTFNRPDERPGIRFYAEGPRSYLSYLLIRTAGEGPAVRESIRKALDNLFEPGREPVVRSYAEEMRHLYDENRKMRDLFLTGCLLSLLISVAGLVGYLSNEASRRSKEVAVRKINGAGTGLIVRMFVADSLKMVLVAAVLGNILTVLAADRYLEQFVHRTGVHPLFLIGADLTVALIAAAAVTWCSWRIAAADPVKSLRSE